jgi:hypothetical protein
MMQNILGYDKSVFADEVAAVISYFNLGTSHWKRILSAAQELERLGVGPKVLNVDEYPEQLTYLLTIEQIVGVEDSGDVYDGCVEDEKMIRNIEAKITIMHNAGWIHGDLCTFNIGYRGSMNDIVFIDYDTCFRMKEFDSLSWIGEWYGEGFGVPEDEITLETAISQDMYGWR